jgi:hypothetical protein
VIVRAAVAAAEQNGSDQKSAGSSAGHSETRSSGPHRQAAATCTPAAVIALDTAA